MTETTNNNKYLPTQLQQYVHLSRYAKWLDKENRRETWEETVGRYVKFFDSRFPGVYPTEMLREAILTLKTMPSMRALMTAGPALERDNVAGFNCFSGETKYLTLEGYKTLIETVGTTQTVLNHAGMWVLAEIQAFGQQPVQSISFRPGARSRTNLRHRVTATPNHRWITTNRGEVTDLREGDTVRFNSSPLSLELNNEAFVRGLGFGDGTLDTRGRARIRLCGDKAKWVDKCVAAGGRVSYPPSYNGDPLVCFNSGVMSDWKQLPSVEDGVYLASWLDGYIAADGHSDPHQPGISSQDAEAVSFVKQIAPLAGYMVTGHNISSITETNYGTRSGLLHRLTLRQEGDFRVTSIEPLDEVEDVYCAVVANGNSFTLEHGIVTGNCSYLAIDHPRAFDEALYILMCGTGLGFSVERQSIASLPVISDDFHPTDTVITVRDSKVGWATAYRELISLLYTGQVP